MLELGGTHKATAYSQTHACLYKLIQWVSERRFEAEPTEVEAAFDTIWRKHGPVDHNSAEEYRSLALQLVRALIRSSTGRRSREVEPLVVDFLNGRVVLEPDEIADMPDGRIALRRIRTGRKRTDEYDHLDYTLYRLAGQAHFGTRAMVQALHLMEETVDDVHISPRKINTRRDRSDEMLSEIAKGQFPPKINEVTCPRCPHFFVCDSTPRGPLTLP